MHATSTKNKKIPVSVIVTVLNEASTIKDLLTSIDAQTTKPSEFVIVDGGSTDDTITLLKAYAKQKHPFIFKLYEKAGNRSVGRNIAIDRAKCNWIAITDAGCKPYKNWLEQLWLQHQKTDAEVIAGYYTAKPSTNFEQAVIPYALVMPDRVDPDTFLPATRSMLMHKKVWRTIGGFDESLSDNEDYAFAKQIEKNRRNYSISFARNALVTWQPRSNLRSFWWMIYRFARGDMQAGILRPKVVLLFARYAVFFALGVWYMLFAADILLVTLVALALMYLAWSIVKNKKYVPDGWHWLPVLQIVSDIGVLSGSIVGIKYRT